jgi:plastocyanin
MQRSGATKLTLALVAIGLASLGGGYAFGASQTITTSPACCQYSAPTFMIDAGQVAQFQNTTSGVDHTMTASMKGPDGKALFDSGTTPSGSAAAVNGTQYLAPGTYHFFCLIHGPSMAADLVVTGNGAPVARPRIKVKVLSKALDKVKSTGKLKVNVKALTDSSGITLTASKGARKLASKANLDLAAGASKTIGLALTGAGRHALAPLHSAKVKLTGTVPFGSPASASRKLG